MPVKKLLKNDTASKVIVIIDQKEVCPGHKLYIFNPFNPGCHLVDDIQNVKEIFCVLSFKLNMFITRDSLYNSRFLSFLCTVIMKLNFKPS
jgi:hypothetical protein